MSSVMTQSCQVADSMLKNSSETSTFASSTIHLRMITVIRKDLQIPAVEHETSRYSYHYSKRLSVHPNELILSLRDPPEAERLRKRLPIDLPTRFNM
jgi:hypothetical protein